MSHLTPSLQGTILLIMGMDMAPMLTEMHTLAQEEAFIFSPRPTLTHSPALYVGSSVPFKTACKTIANDILTDTGQEFHRWASSEYECTQLKIQTGHHESMEIAGLNPYNPTLHWMPNLHLVK